MLRHIKRSTLASERTTEPAYVHCICREDNDIYNEAPLFGGEGRRGCTFTAVHCIYRTHNDIYNEEHSSAREKDGGDVLIKMDLRKVNQMSLLVFKPTIPLRNLKIDEEYRILGNITGGKYGDSLIAELEEAQTFLPKRLIPNLIEHLEDFATGQYCLVNRGLKEFEAGNLAKTSIIQFINDDDQQ
ncbi:hypothetical protein NQ315_013408 [Exocentrus adspersus]|uniref:Uncharacterized protein n=1 Tax=Exocentrus adspersus TaxID=1586481 RepID=A0AAV8VR91_9CUCU|nr:hypothetical protein NQ315_013408 [Exocentrus adspersus]